MKKGLAAILIVIAGGFSAFFFWQFFRSADPEKVLPVDTLGFVRVDFPRKEIAKWRQTALWKEIESSPRKSTYEQQWKRGLAFFESATGVKPVLLWRALRGPVAVGLISNARNSPSLVCVAAVRDREEASIAISENYDSAFKRRLPDLRKEPVKYGQREYYRYSSSHFNTRIEPCYSFQNGYLLVSSTEEAMRRLFDVLEGKVDSIKKNGMVTEAKKALDYDKGIFLYGEIAKILNLSREDSGRKFALMNLVGLRSARTVAYRIGVKEEGFEDSAVLLGAQQQEGLLKIYLEQRPLSLDGIKAVPDICEVVHVISLPALGNMWQQATQQAEKIIPSAQFRAWQSLSGILKGLFGFDIHQDLLDPLGKQLMICYAPRHGDVASRDLLVAVQTKSPEHFSNTVERWLAAGAAPQSTAQMQYKSRSVITSELVIAGMSFKIARYTATPWLFFSNSSELLKRSIDATQDGKRIQENNDFKRVTAGFPDQLNSISYTNVHAYLQMQSALLKKQSLRPDGRWIREYGLDQELSQLSARLFGAASYSQIREDGLYFYSFSSVPAAFLALPAVLSAAPEIAFVSNTLRN